MNRSQNTNVRRSERLKTKSASIQPTIGSRLESTYDMRTGASSAINLPPIDQHQRQNDVTGNRQATSVSNFQCIDQVSLTNSNQRLPSRTHSYYSSAKSSTASNNRRRLEIQLEFAKQKQAQELRQIQQQNRILQMEEELALARIDEEIINSQHDDENNDEAANEEEFNDQRRMQNVECWVNDITNNYNNNRSANSVQQITNPHTNPTISSQFEHYPSVDRDHDMNIYQSDIHEDIHRIASPLPPPATQQYIHRQIDELSQIHLERPPWESIKSNTVYNMQHKIPQHPENQRQQANQLPLNPESQPRLQNIENWITRQSVNKDLPKFSGNPLEWPQFITQYETTTTICRLSNVENQNRLQKCLTGSALSVVQPLLIYPHNIDRVIEILRNRFGRNEHIVHLLLDRVRNFPILKDDKINSLIDFFDVLSNLVYTLESLKELDHMRNPILFNDILNKLPVSQRIDFHQYNDNLKSDIPPILELHKWLERRVNAASKLLLSSEASSKQNCIEKSDSKNQKINKAHTFAMNDNPKPDSSKISYSCPFCKDNHAIYSCNDFKKLDLDARWKFVTDNKICISCLRSNHSLKRCNKRKRCIIKNCTYFHNSLLHKFSDNNLSSQTVESQVSSETNCHMHDENQIALLKIIPVTLKGPKTSIETFALLDEGSTVTLIDSKVASSLGLEGPKKHLRLQWTNDQYNDQKESQIVSVSIKGKNINCNFYTLRRAKTVSDLNLPSQTIDMEKICEKYSYLNVFKHLSYKNGKPMIIIGQDNWPVVVTRKIIPGIWNGPTVSKTLLGWVVHGNVVQNDLIESHTLFHAHELKSDEFENDKDDLSILQDMIKKQWSFDICDTESESVVNHSVDDKRCLKIMNETVKRVDNRFETGIFWINDQIILPESKSNAVKRLSSLEKKMDKDSLYAKAYCAKMNEYISKGYITKLSNKEAEYMTSKTWYLPHFGVVNSNKPGKLRIVFDAASKSNGSCLNDFLLTGPDLYNSLPNILMNFRVKKYAFIGDIKEMFLQIRVREQDRHAQRILWRDLSRDKSPEIYEIQVVFFGAKCSPSIAQEIKIRNATDFRKHFPKAYQEIVDNHYMDDYLGVADTEEEAIQLIQNVIFIHKNGGFEMVNWLSNSSRVLDSLDESLRAKCVMENGNFDFCDSDERVLGMWWDFREDVFKYKLKFDKINPKILSYEQKPTKRDILKIVMSIFDPLGFLSNLVIVGKILMQNIWESGIGWDDPLTVSQYDAWLNWSSNFKNASNFRIPRLLADVKNYTKIDMHIFCDASKHAYAAVVYLRFSHVNNVKCVLINSKARVAPLKPSTIPRLELQAALLGARLGNNIKQSLNVEIDSMVLWCDSVVVLSWIKSSSKRFKTFVAQRVGEIHDLTEPCWWKYVPSKINIADDATKNKAIDFSLESVWLNGPEFLSKSETEWPNGKFDMTCNDTSEDVNSEHVLVIQEATPDIVLPDVLRFSKWSRFIRSVAWVIKLIEKFRLKSKNSLLPNTYELLPEDILKAETLVYRKIQQDSYKLELECLQKFQEIPKSSSLVSFSCFIGDDKLIRINGRLNNSSELDEECKTPIILDSKHDITKWLVRNYHELNNHIGTETIISDLRKRFWITNVRSLVKRVKYECQNCKNLKAKPQIPKMGQLPSCRVDKTLRPFVKCGVDYFGPIEVTVNRRHEKRYGCIFTCMAVRAIHIEIAQDLSFNAFMHIFIQFGNRRGFPEEIYSDNGGNFKKANTEIQKALSSWPQEELVKFCTTRKCKWVFNAPLAPHMGGAWERLIQSIKKHLHAILHERFPREYVLRTLLCEVEGIINNRPLTHNSIDPNDVNPLTPNNFLIGLKSVSFPLKMTTDRDLIVLSMWTASQRLADMFWKRWVSEYLPTIMFSRKWTKESKNVDVGDFVLIVDSDNPRNVWPKGVIAKVYPAADGRVRVVDVKTNSGLFRRPVTKIIKLELINESNSP